MSADEEPLTDLFDAIKRETKRRDEEAAAAREAENQMLREHGIAGILRASTVGGGLYASGPDLWGSVTLFAMTDGTVRWKKA